MAQPAHHPSSLDENAPPIDPGAVEAAYVRERARRRSRSQRRNAAKSSNARFWVVIAVLLFLTVLISLTAWHEVQRTFGL